MIGIGVCYFLHQSLQIVTAIDEILRQGIQQLRVRRLKSPRGRRRIIRVKPGQVKLIGWLLDRYSAFPADCILRYEDLMAEPMRELSRFATNAQPPIRSFSAVDAATRYPRIDLRKLAQALQCISPIAERFYPDFAGDLTG